MPSVVEPAQSLRTKLAGSHPYRSAPLRPIIERDGVEIVALFDGAVLDVRPLGTGSGETREYRIGASPGCAAAVPAVLLPQDPFVLARIEDGEVRLRFTRAIRGALLTHATRTLDELVAAGDARPLAGDVFECVVPRGDSAWLGVGSCTFLVRPSLAAPRVPRRRRPSLRPLLPGALIALLAASVLALAAALPPGKNPDLAVDASRFVHPYHQVTFHGAPGEPRRPCPAECCRARGFCPVGWSQCFNRAGYDRSFRCTCSPPSQSWPWPDGVAAWETASSVSPPLDAARSAGLPTSWRRREVSRSPRLVVERVTVRGEPDLLFLQAIDRGWLPNLQACVDAEGAAARGSVKADAITIRVAPGGVHRAQRRSGPRLEACLTAKLEELLIHGSDDTFEPLDVRFRLFPPPPSHR